MDILWKELVAWDYACAGIQHPLGTSSGIQALGLEALYHGPGAPPTHQTGFEGVNPSSYEGYTTTIITQGSHGYVRGLEAQGGTHDTARPAQGVGEVTGCDLVGLVLDVVGV